MTELKFPGFSEMPTGVLHEVGTAFDAVKQRLLNEVGLGNAVDYEAVINASLSELLRALDCYNAPAVTNNDGAMAVVEKEEKEHVIRAICLLIIAHGVRDTPTAAQRTTKTPQSLESEVGGRVMTMDELRKAIDNAE